MPEPQLLGVSEDFKAEDDKLVRVYGQEFPSHYWEGLQWARAEDARSKTGDLWRVGSIPAVFVEKWLRQGFNIWQEPAKAIVKKCREENLQDFLTTGKRV